MLDMDLTINHLQYKINQGPTGSGKTTIINLLTRFYDVNKGMILLEGHPITDYKIANVREKVGVVLTRYVYIFRNHSR